MRRGGLAHATERTAAFLHVLHGTRGLLLAGTTLLALALLEPFLPAGTPLAVLTLPAFIVLVLGLSTLPREGVAAQWRARSLAAETGAPKRLGRSLVWPSLLCVLLLPKVFLALYGIPHLSPFTGLLLPDLIRRVAVVSLFVVVLVPILYLRSTRLYAPDIPVRRPRDLAHEDGSHAARGMLLWMQGALVLAWGWLTWPFWRPFTLFHWPPSLAMFGHGASSVASAAFAVIVPVLLWTTTVAHLALLQDLVQHRRWRDHPTRTALALVHVMLAVLGAVLHTYAVMWIVRYRSAALF